MTPKARTSIAASVLLLLAVFLRAEQDTKPPQAFWSFTPVSDPKAPASRGDSWSLNGVDRFILEKLRSQGLRPAVPAEKRTLIRRATFDLTGLPPTPDEIAAFLADDSPKAFESVVERLLASPAYGQRWGRHWLDLVRYTDSKDARGFGSVGDVTQGWMYRDWVVDAFNRDYPYPQFISDQVAGDILSSQSPTGLETPRLVATMMLAMGEWGQGDSDKRKMMTDIVDDQVDVVGRGVLGLTLACARCHDHKFDPITTRDYYAMAGFFFSSHIVPNPGDPTQGTPMLQIPLLTSEQKNERARLETQVAELQKQSDQLIARRREQLSQHLLDRTADYLLAAHERGENKTETFASERNLDPQLLSRWSAYLGLPDGREPHVAGLFNEKFDKVGGLSGLLGWRQASLDLPALIANTTDSTYTVQTFTLAAKSVTIHPSPDRSVAVAWRSPITGRVRVTGKVTDADAACGNGVAWSVERSHNTMRQRIAAGVIENGGEQTLTGDPLESLQLQAGDMVGLLIAPRDANHSCDNTRVEFTLTTLEGPPQAWSLTSDILTDPHASNPHADSLGNPGVWHFYSVPTNQAASAAISPDSALGKFARALQDKAELAQLRLLAEQTKGALLAEKPAPADAPIQQALRTPDGFFFRGFDFIATLPPADRAEWDRVTPLLASAKARLAQPVANVIGIQEGGVPTSEHAGFADAKIHIRGRYDRLGDVAPRGFPAVIAAGPAPALAPNSSGRLELARWLADLKNNPLTARVMVNRIWLHHFGRGIVATPDNFGKLGEAPTHPELLDFLASRFTESGGSVKAMHRLVMLSATYQQSSVAHPDTLKADPENKLVGRMNRRRLEVEALRDSILAVSGTLNPAPGGPSVRDIAAPRRTLYITSIRSDNSTFRELFDGSDCTAIIARRNESTVAPQSLFMLNHPLVLAQAGVLAQRVVKDNTRDDPARITTLYEIVYGRPAAQREIEIGLGFLRQGDWTDYCHLLLCANEFIYVD